MAEANGPAEAEPGDGNPPTGGSSTSRSSKGTAGDAGEEARRKSRKTGRFKKVCTTDPDASMATSGRNRRLEPSYKQHAVVDDERGVVLDVAVTTGEANEGDHLLGGLDRTAELTGSTAGVVTADAGYAYAKVFAGLEDRKTMAVIPTKAEPIRSKVPLRRFRYDARHDVLKCPRGKILRPKKAKIAHGRFFNSRVRDCKGCDLAALCLSPSRATKAVVIVHDYPALLRARRRRFAMVRGGRPSLPASPLAVRRLPRRSEDLARARPRRPARHRQHAHPGIPHRSRSKPQAARSSPPGASLDPDRRQTGAAGGLRCVRGDKPLPSSSKSAW